MNYKLKKGVRQVAFAASATARWAVTWANIFIDCPTCDQSIGLKFNDNFEVNNFTDDEFIKIVRDNGWEFIPGEKIVCPDCQKKLPEVHP